MLNTEENLQGSVSVENLKLCLNETAQLRTAIGILVGIRWDCVGHWMSSSTWNRVGGYWSEQA